MNAHPHDTLPKVAIGSRLKGIKNVTTLGVKPNLEDYPEDQRRLLLESPRIYYPTPYYAFNLALLGKELFPSLSTYYYAGDKIRQFSLFSLLKLPQPRTRIYYPGRFHFIRKDFSYPFVAKIPRGMDSGRGVFLIRNDTDLDRYLSVSRVAYIQEYLPIDGDIRVVIIQNRVILAYWRKAAEGEFLSNVARGGSIDFHSVPSYAVDLAVTAARRCEFNDVGVDIIVHEGQSYILEANMRFGRKGFQQAGIDVKSVYERFLEQGII